MSVLVTERLRRAWILPLVIALLSAGAFAAVYAAAIRTYRGQTIEDRALHASTWVPLPSELLQLVTIPHLAIALLALVLIALARKSIKAAVRVVIIVGASNVATQVLKYHVLTRPHYANDYSSNTFPSGHTVAYASMIIGALIVLPAILRPIVAIGGTVLLGTVSYLLLELGWHRASDVMGGTLLVAAITALTILIIPDHSKWAPSLPSKIVVAVLLITFIAGTVATTGLAAFLGLDRDMATTSALLLSSQFLSLSVVAGIMTMMVVLLQRRG